MHVRILVAVFFALNTITLFSQVDTIFFDPSILNPDQLKNGTNSYLHYRQNVDERSTPYDISIWHRTIRREGNQIVLDWQWIMTDSASYMDKTIIVDERNFKPSFISWTSIIKGRKGPKYAFDFRENALTVSKEADAIGYEVPDHPYDFLALCWELDMETFSTLPLEVEKKYSIPFYHPWGEPPAFYTYEVIAKEKVTFGSKDLNAFVLRNYHGGRDEYTDWWIDDSSFQVLKMKSKYGDEFRVKILLASIK